MVLFEHQLADEHGVPDVKNQQMRAGRMEQVVKTLRDRGERPNPLAMQYARITQRSLQFIRWLRYCINHKTPYVDGVELLKPYMLKYIF
jgi:tRNA (Thr-GGU) A37 N-methylase